MRKVVKGSCSTVALVWALSAGSALAQDAGPDPVPMPSPQTAPRQASTSDAQDTDDIIVTGSLIRGTAKDTALPVDVIDQKLLEKRGAPTALDIIRTLPATGAVIGETNLINSAGSGYIGEATANLRGLGANRTLVLMNGRRLTGNSIGVVDINLLPLAAVGRVEVLKDGAAATYGSDAIAGVVNFITRKDYRGVEITANHRLIADSAGDTNVGAVAGFGLASMNVVVSAGYQIRSRVTAGDRDFAARPYFENPQGGWSSNANPGSFRRVSSSGAVIAGPVIDPQCAPLGEVALSPSSCLYSYTPVDDLIEPHKRLQLFSSVDYEFNSAIRFHLEGLYANTRATSNQSPSYTPTQFPTGATLNPGAPAVANRYVIPCSNPGLQDMFIKNPAFAAAIGGAGCINAAGAPADSYAATGAWRYFGVGGTPLTGFGRPVKREINAFRFSGGFNGEIASGVNWDISTTYSANTADYRGADALVDRLQLALSGLGGPGCTGSTPGANGCLYLNPFSNAVQKNVSTGVINPQYNPAVANTSELAAWIEVPYTSHTRNTLLVVDAVLDGKINAFSLPGGNIGWAVGAQYRRLHYSIDYGRYNDLNRTPCIDSVVNPAATCATATGPFNSLASARPVNLQQDIKATFAELNVPLFDSFKMQAALRYEDYGGGVGSTLNPKIAARWQIIPALALRGSFGTTFRGPTPLNLDPAPSTTLSAVTAAGGTSKNIDFFGNPNLKPERATNSNVGALLKLGNFKASVDYWRFNFTDAIVAPSYDAIASSVVPTANGFANCAAPLRSRITFDSGNSCVQGVTAGGNILRVRADVINGPRTTTSGLDFDVSYDFGLLGGELSLSTNATYILNYTVGATSIEGVTISGRYEAAGFLNDDRGGNSLPRFKSYSRADYTVGRSTIGAAVRFVGRYRDNRTAIFTAASPLGRTISPTALIDLNYVVRLQPVTLSVTIDNLLDRDPSFARSAYSYDTFTGDPIGRAIKIGAKVGF